MMSRIQGQPQSGYTQLLEGSFLTTARAVNLDVHHKHCYQIAKFLRGKTTIQAIEYLEKVIKKEAAIPIQGDLERAREETQWLVIERGKWDQGHTHTRPRSNSSD